MLGLPLARRPLPASPTPTPTLTPTPTQVFPFFELRSAALDLRDGTPFSRVAVLGLGLG